MITVENSLSHGIEVAGVVHKDLVMRQARILDNVLAIESAGPDASNLRIRIYKAALQIVSLGTLKEVTGRQLLELPEDDMEPIFDAQDELEKKALGLKSDSSPSGK